VDPGRLVYDISRTQPTRVRSCLAPAGDPHPVEGWADTTTASRDRSFVPCPLAVGSPPGRGAWTRLVATVTSVRDRYTWIPVVPGGLQGPPWSPGIPHDPQHARFDAPSPSGNQTHTNQGSLYLVKRLDVYSSVAAAIAGIIMFCSVVIRDWDPHTGAGTIDMVGFSIKSMRSGQSRRWRLNTAPEVANPTLTLTVTECTCVPQPCVRVYLPYGVP
jgi:hypothetical protein